MLDRATLLALKGRLLRTWPAFFECYGNFTAAQVAAISALLDGANVLLSAPTASGKTAAVLAPLIEQFDVPRFLAVVSVLRPLVAPEGLREELELLLK